jgi:hypothetical protein
MFKAINYFVHNFVDGKKTITFCAAMIVFVWVCPVFFHKHIHELLSSAWFMVQILKRHTEIKRDKGVM